VSNEITTCYSYGPKHDKGVAILLSRVAARSVISLEMINDKTHHSVTADQTHRISYTNPGMRQQTHPAMKKK